MQIKAFRDGILKDILKEELSKKYIRYLKRQNALFYLNGHEIKNYYEIKKDDLIDIEFSQATNKEERLYDIHLDIIYENEDFIVINKPRNLNTIPSRKEPQKSLYNALYTYLLKNNKLKTIHIITRLDRKTSGLVLIALNKEAALFLNKNHSKIHKIYYARVKGIIEENHFIVDKPISKDEETGKRIIDFNGKPSKTEFYVLERKNNMTCLKCILYTGRTHQIRLHLASIGYPIIGDDLYGEDAECLNLECHELTFIDSYGLSHTFKLPPAAWMKE
jgi:hypothetical protein